MPLSVLPLDPPAVFRCQLGSTSKSLPLGDTSGKRTGLPAVFEKDILRTGLWTVGARQWVVTTDTLRRLVDNFNEARRRGIRIPVVWNHSWDARDKIGEVLALSIVADTLWARFRAFDPGDIRRLATSSHEVSVEVRQPWRDGGGKVYDCMLTHVAVVQLPVVSNQFPFRLLTLSRLHKGDLPMSDAVVSTDANRSLVRALNQLLTRLPSWNLLGEETPLPAVVLQLETLAGDFSAAPVGLEDVNRLAEAQNQELITRLRAELDDVRQQLAAAREQAVQQQRQQFEEAVNRLVREGRIAPSDRQGLLEAAEPIGYRLSLLVPFEKVPVGSALPMQPHSRTTANPAPPPILPSEPMTSEKARQLARSYRQ